jgi:hypothetical protein
MIFPRENPGDKLKTHMTYLGKPLVPKENPTLPATREILRPTFVIAFHRSGSSPEPSFHFQSCQPFARNSPSPRDLSASLKPGETNRRNPDRKLLKQIQISLRFHPAPAYMETFLQALFPGKAAAQGATRVEDDLKHAEA